jgi:hypothetical protein
VLKDEKYVKSKGIQVWIKEVIMYIVSFRNVKCGEEISCKEWPRIDGAILPDPSSSIFLPPLCLT